MKHFKTAFFAFLAAAFSMTAYGHGYTVGTLAIDHPYALPTPPGATTAGGYITDLGNQGTAEEKLIGATSPAADHVELHNMGMDGNVMRMREVPAIVVAPGQHVLMAPGGGYHLMLIGIRKPFAIGDKVPVTLQFEHAGKVDVVLDVQARGAAGDAMGHDHAMMK